MGLQFTQQFFRNRCILPIEGEINLFTIVTVRENKAVLCLCSYDIDLDNFTIGKTLSVPQMTSC